MATNKELEARVKEVEAKIDEELDAFASHIVKAVSRLDKLEAQDEMFKEHINLLVGAIRACGVDPGIPYTPPNKEEGYR